MEDGNQMIKVIYEDNHLLVVVKPINMPTQEDNSKDLDMLTMIKQYIKEKYKNFLYIDCMPAEKKNVAFYEKYGFSVMENGTAMQICNYCNS